VETITVNVGQSQMVKAPWPVKRVSITDPNVADVKVLTADQVLVMGKNVGTTDLLMWNEREELWQARVEVGRDVAYIRAELARLFPRSTLTVTQSREMIVVSGQHAHAEDVAQLHKFLDATAVKYVDITTVAGVQQVQIQVRIAEVSRTSIRALGVNGFMTGNDSFGGVTIGPESGGAMNPISIGVPDAAAAAHGLPFQFTADTSVSSSVTLFGGFPNADLEIFLQALAENQYLRILAEPTLVALSGQEASFLAGGEFPYPVSQAGAGVGTTSITIEWKEYGVRLRFRPTVLGDGKISLFVAPEVSELDFTRAVTAVGTSVPAVVTRKAQTTLELKSGQSFGMAGLINRSISGRSSRVPGLGDLPVLGALFRSARYSAGETELVVLVTASLVEPMSVTPSPPLPGEADSIPNDWEFYALGKLEGAPVVTSPAMAAWLKSSGLDRLRGPGAWARYDAPPAEATTQPAPGSTEPPSGQP
jgi:pilus assembly protein CpaC